MSEQGTWLAIALICAVAGVLFVLQMVQEHLWKDDIERDRLKKEEMDQALLTLARNQARPPAE